LRIHTYANTTEFAAAPIPAPCHSLSIFRCLIALIGRLTAIDGIDDFCDLPKCAWNESEQHGPGWTQLHDGALRQGWSSIHRQV
jgi:hypothetical protein